MTRRYTTGGYVYGSDPNAPLERAPDRRLPLGTIIALLGITFAVVLFALFPAASSVTPRNSTEGSTPRVAEAGVGRDIP